MKKRVLVGMAALLLSFSLLMAQEIPAGVITANIIWNAENTIFGIDASSV